MELLVDLILLNMSEFHVIVRLDSLASYHAMANYFCNTFNCSPLGQPAFQVKGTEDMRIIFAIKARWLLKIGCFRYLVSLNGEKKNKLKLEDTHVVCKYPDVFLGNFLSLPLMREVEF